MNMQLVDVITKKQLRKDIPDFKAVEFEKMGTSGNVGRIIN